MYSNKYSGYLYISVKWPVYIIFKYRLKSNVRHRQLFKIPNIFSFLFHFGF